MDLTKKQQYKKSTFLLLFISFASTFLFAQVDSTEQYKKRVLETTEVDFLSSYYAQSGDNAAVSGGIGSEELSDVTGAIVVSVPINDDDVLTIDAGISAYTSASSSNIDAFDGDRADPFQASTGASSGDLWANFTGTYSHSSDSRNEIWSAKVSVSSEYDYFSVGAGGSFTKLLNQKNTELSVNANVFIDTWNAIYPTELRPFQEGGNGLNDRLFTSNTLTGNANYAPEFSAFADEGRNTYSLGLGFSQILSKRIQGSLALDLVQQEGLLSTPFQRVYFSDVADTFIEDFQLADDVERLPGSRSKLAIGGRLNVYLNENFVLRSFYRFYTDNWGIQSHTASLELPIKIGQRFTLYPSYRYYNQSAADYFAPYEEHLSTSEFYTSDFDLSAYNAHQLGFGVSYTDLFAESRIWKFGLKSIDLRFYKYDRDTTFSSYLISGGVKFVLD